MFQIEPVTLILSLVLMCVFSIPFIYHTFHIKQKSKKLFAHFYEITLPLQANPCEIGVWRYMYALRLDTSRNILAYSRQGIDAIALGLNLADYLEVNPVKVFKDTPRNTTVNTTYKLPEFVALELVPKTDSLSKIVLEVYDGNLYSDLLGVTILEEKWYEIINNRLK